MGGFCGGGSSTTSSSTSSRASERPPAKPVKTSLATDIKMGLSTFGQDKETQAKTLLAAGYSSNEVKSYQDRTAASQAKLAEMTSSGGGDRKPAPAPTPPAPAPEPPAPVVPAPPVVAPPPAPPPVADTSSDFTPGPAETKVIEDAAKKTGWSGTVKTTSRGLTTPAKTRGRRSLISGAETQERLLR